MADTVKIIINDKEYEVPAGMNLVDAAKWHADDDIPVFCYHPKMDPVGMCRMCLVEMGTVEKDRETGDVVMEGDKAKVRWFPKLMTACTERARDGLVIKTDTKKVKEGREHVLEFILTSHPLDCPICDKGGECPLQNLTMAHGPGVTRMYFDDKIHMDKHVPLGDLIFLDRERCIQCARCIRYQDEVVGDDVLAFHERGRRLQIITNSDPGFDTYFSGNTTDICPVGALTTADFRFGARPWELTEVPSISPWDAAGENISLSTRLDRDSGGKTVIRRVMPRQNEYVNEIWISDKTRFGHHFTNSADRLAEPQVRRGDSLSTSLWSEVLPRIADVLKSAGGDVAAIAGSGATNEDLWELRQLMAGLGSDRLGAWPPTHAGADLVAQVGVGKGTNLTALGKGDAVLVIASDLEEEVPIWRHRIKQAQDRGAFLVVANSRRTRMEDFALHTQRNDKAVSGAAIRYETGQAANVMANLSKDHKDIAKKLGDANNLVIIAGAEGLSLDGSRALMQAAANFLIDTKHVGKANNGLMATFPGPNGMGQYYLGYTPETTQAITANPPKVLIVLQAEPLNDDPAAAEWLGQVDTVINLSLFADKATAQADFALPIQSFAERDGSFVNGERRVQRFFTAQGPVGEALPAWQVLSRVREQLGQGTAKASAAAVMLDITKNVDVFDGMRYKELGEVERQFPDVGGKDLYYGGTVYQNKGGLGVQIASAADNGEVKKEKVALPDALKTGKGDLVIVPVTRLYNRESAFKPSALVHGRVADAFIAMNSDDAKAMKVSEGDIVDVNAGDAVVQVVVRIDDSVAAGSAILPRNMSDNASPLAPVVGSVSRAKEAVV